MTQRVRPLDEPSGFLNNPDHVYNLEISKIRNGVYCSSSRCLGRIC
jgi:hypothetical protein